MGVFGNKKEDLETEVKQAESEAISSIIDASMVLTGEIAFKGKTRIDGQLTGNIKGEHLILSKTGSIEGDIEVTSFVCHGSMKGNAKANIVTLRKECSIQGKIEAKSLTVEPGAAVDGEIRAATKDINGSFNQKDLAVDKAPSQAKSS